MARGTGQNCTDSSAAPRGGQTAAYSAEERAYMAAELAEGNLSFRPRETGKAYFFEYHCLEAEDSSDAALWHHTHQTATVLSELGPEDCDAECGLMYRVLFTDGFSYDVAADELCDTTGEWERPDYEGEHVAPAYRATLWHGTSPRAAAAIVREGFQPGPARTLWATSFRGEANGYGATLVPVEVTLRRPLVLEAGEDMRARLAAYGFTPHPSHAAQAKLAADMLALGFDGIVQRLAADNRDPSDPYPERDVVHVFDPACLRAAAPATPPHVYTMLGTSDEQTDCDLCGRSELKHTVCLRDNETGEVVHYGSDCAARALGWTEQEVRSNARDADRAAREAAAAARRSAQNEEQARWAAFLKAQTGLDEVGEAVTALGGFTAAHSRYRAEQIHPAV